MCARNNSAPEATQQSQEEFINDASGTGDSIRSQLLMISATHHNATHGASLEVEEKCQYAMDEADRCVQESSHKAIGSNKEWAAQQACAHQVKWEMPTNPNSSSSSSSASISVGPISSRASTVSDDIRAMLAELSSIATYQGMSPVYVKPLSAASECASGASAASSSAASSAAPLYPASSSISPADSSASSNASASSSASSTPSSASCSSSFVVPATATLEEKFSSYVQFLANWKERKIGAKTPSDYDTLIEELSAGKLALEAIIKAHNTMTDKATANNTTAKVLKDQTKSEMNNLKALIKKKKEALLLPSKAPTISVDDLDAQMSTLALNEGEFIRKHYDLLKNIADNAISSDATGPGVPTPKRCAEAAAAALKLNQLNIRNIKPKDQGSADHCISYSSKNPAAMDGGTSVYFDEFEPPECIKRWNAHTGPGALREWLTNTYQKHVRPNDVAVGDHYYALVTVSGLTAQQIELLYRVIIDYERCLESKLAGSYHIRSVSFVHPGLRKAYIVEILKVFPFEVLPAEATSAVEEVPIHHGSDSSPGKPSTPKDLQEP